MNMDRRPARDISDCLRRRLQQRYLRWLAQQPVENVFLSEGWRSFWRSYRRRANRFFQSRPVVTLMYCLAACGLLLILGVLSAVLIGLICCFLPKVFFSAPDRVSFVDDSQRAAVALTRLTVFQSVALPLLFLWASQCFRNSVRLEIRDFYKKRDASQLIGYRIGFIGFVVCSAAVSVAATLGHDGSAYGAAASLIVTACLSWLAWAVGERMMAIQWRPNVSSISSPVTTVCILTILLCLVPAVAGLCYGPAVLSVSQYLAWLGPLGWVNAQLFGVSHGQTQNLLPLGFFCVVAAYLGYLLDSSTRRWAFRRQLLSIYRTREPRRDPLTSVPTDKQQVARELRQVISEGSWPTWKTLFCPRWLVGHATSLILTDGAMFALQLIFAGLVLFLESLEDGAGQPLREKLVLCALLSSVGGWNVLLLEGFAACLRDQAVLSEFAKRPVSPGVVWEEIQRDGLRFAPTQVLYSTPFVALTAVMAPEYFVRSCIAVAVALLSCFAIRTALAAGACYAALIANLREWLASWLQTLGMFAGVILLMGIVGSAIAMGTEPDSTLGVLAVNLFTQQITTLTALGLTCACWHAIGRTKQTCK